MHCVFSDPLASSHAPQVPHRVFSLVVHPDPSSMVVAVGDKWGHVALWQPLKAKEHMDV